MKKVLSAFPAWIRSILSANSKYRYIFLYFFVCLFSVLVNHLRLDILAHRHLVPSEVLGSTLFNKVSVHKGTYLLYIQCYIYRSVCMVLVTWDTFNSIGLICLRSTGHSPVPSALYRPRVQQDTRLWATWFSGKCPCPWQGVETRWPLRSLPTQTILWFCEHVLWSSPSPPEHPSECFWKGEEERARQRMSTRENTRGHTLAMFLSRNNIHKILAV